MPYIIHPRRIRRIVAAIFGSALLLGSVPALAGAACPSSPSTTALAKFGDTAAYTLLSGGTFESGAPGWSLTEAEVVGGSGANGDTGSLVIQQDGVAVSPAFCVSSEYPSFRFFARQVSGGEQVSDGDRVGGEDRVSGGDGRFTSLNVSLRWRDLYGFSHDTSVAQLQPGSAWTLSPVLKLATALPMWMNQSTLSVRLVFEPNDGGAWAIDDIYIDPYRR